MCIFVLPFLTLINEKELKIGPLLSKLGLKYLSSYSTKRPNILDDDPPRVIFCTIEKAN